MGFFLYVRLRILYNKKIPYIRSLFIKKMKNLLLIALISFLSFNSFAQISFEKGYFINNNNQKTECLIKNKDSRINPSQFEYKLTENGTIQLATIKTIKEFGIYNAFKYQRFLVDIDKSSESSNIANRSTAKDPVFVEEELFLKVLVEGEANLYTYIGSQFKRFFIKTNITNIEQLVYKTYKTIDNNNYVGKNNSYKQKLWNTLKCESISMEDKNTVKYNRAKLIKLVEYKKSDLIKLFVAYNECKGANYTNYESNRKGGFLNISIRPGINTSSISIKNEGIGSKATNYGNKLGIRLGIEAEYVLPFGKNKWAFLVEPTYKYYKSDGVIILRDNYQGVLSTNSKITYQYIEVPIGLRHYSFINENLKLFINASFTFNHTFSNSKITSIDRPGSLDLELTSGSNFILGIGFQYNNRYSLELRYAVRRSIFDYYYWGSGYKNSSLIFGYTLF